MPGTCRTPAGCQLQRHGAGPCPTFIHPSGRPRVSMGGLPGVKQPLPPAAAGEAEQVAGPQMKTSSSCRWYVLMASSSIRG